MTRAECLQVKLAQEASEVAHITTKALLFGLHEKYEGPENPKELDNAARILDEIEDMLVVLEMLKIEVGLDLAQISDPNERERKRAKIEKWLTYSQRVGTLTETRTPKEVYEAFQNNGYLRAEWHFRDWDDLTERERAIFSETHTAFTGF